jgi:hypothetical protein
VLGHARPGCVPYLYAVVDPATSTIDVRSYDYYPPPPCAPQVWTAQLPLGRLAPGVWAVKVTLDGTLYATDALTVAASPTTVTLGSFGYFGTNFRLEVEWVDPRTGEHRLAPGLWISDRAAQFWFFDSGLPELTVKILDGTDINGHHWLFASSMTGVEHTLRIRLCVEGDPPYCEEPKTYHSPAGSNLDIVDVEAFD